MGAFDNLKDQAQQQASAHPDQAEKLSDAGVQKGGDALDDATGDKYGDKVDQGQQGLDAKIGE